MKLKTITLAVLTIGITGFGVLKSAQYSNLRIEQVHSTTFSIEQISQAQQFVVGPVGSATIKKIVANGKKTIILPVSSCTEGDVNNNAC
jgi:hypothetical protein